MNDVDVNRKYSLALTLISVWGGRSPDSASKWLTTFPGTLEQKSVLYGYLVKSWLKVDPEAASKWIAKLEPGPIRTECIKSLILKTAAKDPERAFEWAKQLPEELGSEMYLYRAYSHLHQLNPLRAKELLHQSGFSAELKKKIDYDTRPKPQPIQIPDISDLPIPRKN